MNSRYHTADFGLLQDGEICYTYWQSLPRGGIYMTGSQAMKWLTGVFELILAIPIVGGIIVVASSYSVLGIMLALHILTLVLSAMNKEAKYGSIMGIVTCVLGWIPFVGWFLHLVSAILLMVSAAQRARA